MFLVDIFEDSDVKPRLLALFSIFLGTIFVCAFQAPTRIFNGPSNPDQRSDAGSHITSPLLAQSLNLPFDPNQIFSYNCSESCNESIDWSPVNTTDVAFNVPSSYNSTWANISVMVMNATLNETVIQGNTTTPRNSRNEQAVGFITNYDGYMNGFSICTNTLKSAESVTTELRDVFNGSTLASFPVIMSTGPAWINVTLTPPIFLPAGHYYLYMPSVNNSVNAWQRTTVGVDGDTWINNQTSGNWELQNWNLTLIIYTSPIISPQAAGMTIASQNVHDIDPSAGTGWANISAPLSGPSISFPVTNTTPIAYSFAVNANIFRNTIASISMAVNQTNPNWTLAVPLDNPGTPFFNYQANITGFPFDAYNIIAYAGSAVLGYTRTNPGSIFLNAQANIVTFQSPNYIATVNFPPDIYTGDVPYIDVTTQDVGNVSVFIYQGPTLVYQNSTISSSLAAFRWEIPPGAIPGPLTIQTYYIGNNEIGSNETTTRLETDARLNTTGIVAAALGVVGLNCSYFEAYSGNPIPNAQVTFGVGNLSGQISYQNSGNYSVALDLSEYALVPGNYALSVQAEKDGYRPCNQTLLLQIIARPVSVQLAQSATTVHPGEAVQFDLNIIDTLTGGFLSRPVNATMQIFPAGEDHTNPQLAIASYSFTGITTTGQYTWFIPNTVLTGEYDVVITIDSPYFAGSKLLAQAINVIPNLFWPLVVAIGAAASICTGIYVHREKIAAKRSVKGVMILNQIGTAVIQKISPDFSASNPLLVSGAVSGVITLMREITGKGLRRIKVEGGYIELVQRPKFWVVLLMHHNPGWVGGTIGNLADEIESKFGAIIAEWKGEELDLPILVLVKKWFGVEILKERSLGMPSEQNTTGIK
ncbi:MAG TPA: carboxypeptidase-like regulatory domain-containing protein [Candidatus Lokiarchaeia archaeon]|nr:carboxypeptidase-like regulatory domain-containing protein [Candidatus Lokiarchaeia archaeon]